MPTSKLTLVLVDGFWKIIPSVFPRKNGRDLPLLCSCLSFPASIRIVPISFVLKSAILRMSFLLEEIFNVFICQIDYFVLFFLLFSFLIFSQIPLLIASLRLFFLQLRSFISFFFFFLFLCCRFFFWLVLVIVLLVDLFFAAIFICSFLAKESKPALFFFGLLLQFVWLRLMHRSFWYNFFDCLLLLLKGRSVYGARCLDWRLG